MFINICVCSCFIHVLVFMLHMYPCVHVAYVCLCSCNLCMCSCFMHVLVFMLREYACVHVAYLWLYSCCMCVLVFM